MAIVSLDVATAGGGAMAATKRMAQRAIDRWKDDFIGKKEGFLRWQISGENAR
jgi:hypothetical protein